MKVGVLVCFNNEAKIDAMVARVEELGFDECQITCWCPQFYTDENVEKLQAALDRHHVRITTFWTGYTGPCIWNFTEGPLTIGLVPTAYRAQRIRELCAGADFAKKLGVTNIATHVGFLPENPNTTEYREVVEAIRFVAQHCKDNDQYFLFETGQETPVTILRTIELIGTGNLGVNLDPANLILYGKANPVDALDVFGKYVRNVHAKDGLYPTDGTSLGREVAIGEGKVNFPALIEGLKKVGYDGPLTIEREISGDQQTKDILAARKLLESLI